MKKAVLTALSATLLVVLTVAMAATSLAADNRVFALYSYGFDTGIQAFDADTFSWLAPNQTLNVPGHDGIDLMRHDRSSKLYASNQCGVDIVDIANGGFTYDPAGQTAIFSPCQYYGGHMSLSKDGAQRFIFVPFSITNAGNGIVKVLDTTTGKFLTAPFTDSRRRVVVQSQYTVPCDAFSTAVSATKLYVGCYQTAKLYEFNLTGATFTKLYTSAQGINAPIWKMDHRNNYLFMSARAFTANTGGFSYMNTTLKSPKAVKVTTPTPEGVVLNDAFTLAYVPSAVNPPGVYVVGGSQQTNSAWVFSAAQPPSLLGTSVWMGYLHFPAAAAHPDPAKNDKVLLGEGYYWNLYGFEWNGVSLISYGNTGSGYPPPQAVAGRPTDLLQ